MKFIVLTKGYVAIVDDDDFERLSQYKWSASVHPRSKTVYAQRHEAGRVIQMHRSVLDAPQSQHVDHYNHCGIDNRKENLRLCTITQNARNRSTDINWAGKTSKYKGVGFMQSRDGAAKWLSRIKVNRKSKHLGWFMTELEAVRAYNEAAKHYFGEFACLNEIADAAQ